MPSKPGRICPCGFKVPGGERCSCQLRRDRERKARHDLKRPSSSARGYNPAWQKESAEFRRANPSCRRCGAPATLVDHIEPHRGNMKLFWNRANWQPLCTPCHSRAKQAEEKAPR
ncbi:HNH endonuclease [Fulvimarina sp. 2208YS6-2-32]|uniref:HNH endonuclease n=1 Tax=Fulvimarina uroteuthidis TaxID=3098149 RepID=A0ABU5HXA3_9HYPH|nr:HNH endonuclease [Fulvimarina sp. 2208YS6-2-32]MDY8107761.1 HNH endonuclease [Fulvimarina sp. 2208YS6-2-32]